MSETKPALPEDFEMLVGNVLELGTSSSREET